VIELASHIQITSNITTPTRKHADTQHDRKRGHPRGPTPSKGYMETRRNTPTPRAQAREFSRPRPLKSLPHHTTTKKNRKQRTQDFTPGSITPQQLQLFIYRLSWVVYLFTYLSSTCITINYLYFLFRYALLYFSIHSIVHFGLFLISDLFVPCHTC